MRNNLLPSVFTLRSEMFLVLTRGKHVNQFLIRLPQEGGGRGGHVPPPNIFGIIKSTS